MQLIAIFQSVCLEKIVSALLNHCKSSVFTSVFCDCYYETHYSLVWRNIQISKSYKSSTRQMIVVDDVLDSSFFLSLKNISIKPISTFIKPKVMSLNVFFVQNPKIFRLISHKTKESSTLSYLTSVSHVFFVLLKNIFKKSKFPKGKVYIFKGLFFVQNPKIFSLISHDTKKSSTLSCLANICWKKIPEND